MLKTLNILLVDDDEDDQFFFKEALKKLDHSGAFYVAGDGIKALHLLRNGTHPDIVFLDLNMPQMNGFDFLTTIRGDEKYKKLPVVIYTTSRHKQDIDRAEELSAIGFLTKPSNLNNLSLSLEKALQLYFSDNNRLKIID